MLSNGQSVIVVAEQQGVKPEKICEWHRKWLRNGLSSLSDQPLSGAPNKLTDAHRNQLKEWTDAKPLNCQALVIV